ncbi:hypothetical protein [Streptomyces sp. NPDC055400]
MSENSATRVQDPGRIQATELHAFLPALTSARDGDFAKAPWRCGGMPGFKTRRAASPGLHRTTRGFGLEGGRLHLAGGLVRSVVWSPAGTPAGPVFRSWR